MSSFSVSFLSTNKRPQEFASTKLNTAKADLLKVLNILNHAEDNDLHVKMFSVLAVYLINNKEYTDLIVTNTTVYDRLYILLTRGQITIKARILNFISAMLFTDEEAVFSKSKSSVIYAQNMIRISGCLVAMCDLFLSSMMPQETWKALCICVAAACQDFVENQTYCSHLVPLCVQKCHQGDIDVMVPLKSLINNHSRNMQLFLECDGLSIFEKEILQHDTSMQFLDVVVQNTTAETLATLYKSAIKQLRYFTAEFGLESRVGQWATVILHHFNSRIKECNITEHIDKNDSKETKQEHRVAHLLNYDETAKLLQNVIREIYQYNANYDEKVPLTEEKLSIFPKNNIKNYTSRQSATGTRLFSCEQTTKNKTVKPVTESRFENSVKELSFSFLSKNQWDNRTKNVQNSNTSNLDIKQRRNPVLSSQSIKDRHEDFNDITKTSYSKNSRRQSVYNKENTVHYEHNTMKVCDFKPAFVSTPKHLKCRHESLSTRKNTQMSQLSRSTFKKVRRQNFKRQSRINHKTMEESKEHDSTKNRSLSSRFLDAINDSCTTFVKTVTNIFRSKKVPDSQKTATAVAKGDPSCNYSFTDYMRKRDAALLERQMTKSTDESNNIDSCKTCNDTLLLKRKILDDNYLKETVNKLKVAINLYGCDFKKISRTIWPHESYMTPEVLYNLYRKVILK